MTNFWLIRQHIQQRHLPLTSPLSRSVPFSGSFSRVLDSIVEHDYLNAMGNNGRLASVRPCARPVSTVLLVFVRMPYYSNRYYCTTIGRMPTTVSVHRSILPGKSLGFVLNRVVSKGTARSGHEQGNIRSPLTHRRAIVVMRGHTHRHTHRHTARMSACPHKYDDGTPWV